MAHGGERCARWAALALALLVALPLLPGAAAGATVSVIVRAADADRARLAVESAGGEVTYRLPIVDGVAASIPGDAVADLDARPGIDVSENAPVHVQGKAAKRPPAPTPPVFVQAVKADKLWKAGYTGTGVTVAVVDTGISPVPDLAGRVVGGIDFTPEQDPLRDSFGHGTFVAGLIAGDGASSGGARKGIAPGARVLSIKIAGEDGSSDVAHVLAALQWAVSFKDTYKIKVLNLSLGTDSTQPYRLSPLNYAVEKAWDAGIVVVVSASNRGAGGRRTVTKPADDPLVITVGATDDRGTATATDDVMAGFSGRGPTAADGLTKPDVVAPGTSLVSLRAPGSKIDTGFPGARVDRAYFRGSGTSFSSAITAGGAALLLQANRNWTPNDIKARMMSAALAGPSADRNVSGAGRLDLDAARTIKKPQAANQNVARSLGTGSLDADRGTLQTTIELVPGVPVLLDGELTPTGALYDPRQFLKVAWTGTSWYTSQWAGTSWYGTSWYGTSWYGTSWYGTSWYAVTWG